MKTSFLIFLFSFFSLTMAHSQVEIPLYPQGPAESNKLENLERYRDANFIFDISNARMYYHPAPKDKANGTAVLICPGGGYAGVSQIKEGSDIAKWFNDLGVSAFVLYYRMPNGHYNIPLKDGQTALEIIHKRAKEWNIDKKKIGIIGFSAGGHLASTAGTHFKTKKQRPAFMILAYPVVTMDSSYTHMGSRRNLLGKNPSDDLVELFSNELQVKKKTPPTFIVHARNDGAVPIANSENLKKALEAKNISCEMQVYDLGGHGFGMLKRGIPADNWPNVLKSWLIKHELIAR
jgi:acetyl esterase/lipase